MKKLYLLAALMVSVLVNLKAQDTLNLIPPSDFQGESPVMTDYAHLTWEEPFDTITGTTPSGLLGYNIYRDGEVIGSIDVPALEYYDLNLEMFTYVYYISAVYDLTSYGFPGETGESSLEGPVEVILCCLPQLPFTEDFTTGVFETNQWTAEGNWHIAGQMGNPAPSAEFSSTPVITDYSNSLTSYWFSGTGFIDGDIFLDFGLYLNTNQDSTEFLYVDVYNGEEWINKATYDNSQAYDWTQTHLNITTEAKGEQFRIRFRAEGESSANIQRWNIDNIQVYRECGAPFNLTASYPGGLHFCEVLLEWIAPDTTNGTTTWLEWDNSINSDAVGLEDGGTFLVASRFAPAQLAQYAGTNLTRIRMFPYSDNGTVVLKVWTGANASQLMVSQPVPSYIAGQWNEFALNTPVPVTGATELWFGYSVTHDSSGIYLAGVDGGPAVAGYGDLISMDGSLWESMGQAYGLDYNWNLAGYLEPTGKTRSLDHYNIYREGEYLNSATETTYTDTINDAPGQVFCYNVTAVYEDCESEFSNMDCWWQFEPCDVGVDDINANEPEIFPNPASSMITVSGKSLQEVIMYDILGNQIQEKRIPSTQESTAMDIKNLSNGVYLVKIINTSGESVVRKMVVKH